MKKFLKIQLFLALLLSAAASFSQVLTLDSAYALARNHYPLLQQQDLIRQTAGLTIDNISKGLLPQLSFNGQGSYQSDVTRVDIKVPGISITPPAKDQYKLTADLSQLLYDGGIIREQQRFQELSAVTEQQKLEVELYKLRDRVNQVYFGILLTDEQIEQVKLARKDLDAGISKVKAQVENGVALRSSLNVLKAEMLKNDQRIYELAAQRVSLVAVLAVFTGLPLQANLQLQRPQPGKESSGIDRPEQKMFDAQIKLADQQFKLLHARNMPKASAFVQGGYGRPGLNMLKNDFSWFYIAGVRVNWSLGNLYTYRSDKKLVEISKRAIDVQKKTFEYNTSIQLIQQSAELVKYRKLLTTDEEIVALRKSVKEAALAQLENGVITSNDYIREVTAEDQARAALITHELQLLLANINYQTIAGK